MTPPPEAFRRSRVGGTRRGPWYCWASLLGPRRAKPHMKSSSDGASARRQNTGRRLFAFNWMQQQFLPEEYRPPQGTARGGVA